MKKIKIVNIAIFVFGGVFIFFNSGLTQDVSPEISQYDYDAKVITQKDFDLNQNPYAELENFYSKNYEWVIDNFTTIFHVEADSTVKVDERILVNFFTPSHGIFRYIPTTYTNDQGLVYNLRLNFDSVTDQFGKSYNIVSKKRKDPFMIQVGDVDKLITGKSIYRIKYSTERGIRYFDDHDELYWNVTGWDWEVPILYSRAIVILPKIVNRSDVRLKCYMGEVKSTEQNCDFKFLDDRTIQFVITRPMNDKVYPKEDFTIAVWLPKGVVAQPSQIKQLSWLFLDNCGMFIFPLVVFIIMFLIWRKWGKERKFDKTVIAQYEENEELTPAVAGMLLKDSNLDTKHLSAEIIYLATRKYLRIEEVLEDKSGKVKDYKLVKLKDADSKLKDFQSYLMKKLFGSQGTVLISSFTNKFYQYLPELTKKAAAYCKKYYYWGSLAKSIFVSLGVVFGFLITYLGGALERIDIMIGGIISGIIIIVFGIFMAKKSDAGNEALWYVKGYKLFIETAEKYRAKFYEDENIFDRILPYAMVFGMVDKWVKEFKNIYKKNPDWYQSTRPINFMLFNSALSSFVSKSNSSLRSMPASRGGSSSSSGFSSGGGGFSGGGFGGGGGGRW